MTSISPNIPQILSRAPLTCQALSNLGSAPQALGLRTVIGSSPKLEWLMLWIIGNWWTMLAPCLTDYFCKCSVVYSVLSKTFWRGEGRLCVFYCWRNSASEKSFDTYHQNPTSNRNGVGANLTMISIRTDSIPCQIHSCPRGQGTPSWKN